MDKYAKYDEILNSEKTVAIILIMLIVITMIALIIFGLKIKLKYITSGAIIVGLIGTIFMYLVGVFPYDKDINENAYETYVGEFIIEDYFSTNRGRSYVIIKCNENTHSLRYEVLCDVPNFELYTIYEGSFTVSQNSKCLMDIDINAT